MHFNLSRYLDIVLSGIKITPDSRFVMGLNPSRPEDCSPRFIMRYIVLVEHAKALLAWVVLNIVSIILFFLLFVVVYKLRPSDCLEIQPESIGLN
tara:strand:+ start:107 stop:391 length:285 start_codon:yes stop_codon:yes gene_type:complete